jgi:hypothetical protein
VTKKARGAERVLAEVAAVSRQWGLSRADASEVRVSTTLRSDALGLRLGRSAASTFRPRA